MHVRVLIRLGRIAATDSGDGDEWRVLYCVVMVTIILHRVSCTGPDNGMLLLRTRLTTQKVKGLSSGTYRFLLSSINTPTHRRENLLSNWFV
jgi:hypothetical protein